MSEQKQIQLSYGSHICTLVVGLIGNITVWAGVTSYERYVAYLGIAYLGAYRKYIYRA